MVEMKNQMDGFAKTEQITNEKVSTIENSVAELVEQGKGVKTQMTEMKKQIQETDDDVISHNFVSGWKVSPTVYNVYWGPVKIYRVPRPGFGKILPGKKPSPRFF